MRKADLEKYIGEVVILDLVSGMQVTTKLTDIEPGPDAGDGTPRHEYAIVDKLLIFSVSVEVRDPRKDPHPIENPFEHKVRNVFYGYPLFETKDDTPIDLDHIMMAHDCQADMAKVYTKVTTGIEIADAGALNALDAASKGRIQL